MKNILLLLHDDDGQEARLQAALDVTRAVSGHLTCLDIALPPALAADYFVGAGDAIVLGYVTEREVGNRAATEARLRREDVPWTMLEAIGAPGLELERMAGLSDLIVVSGGDQASPEARHLAGQLAAKCDRAVLAVPPRCKTFNAAGPALVAWNGSREACDALRAVVPLLALAASVTLVEIDAPSGEASSAEAAAYLSRHGIEARIAPEAGDGPVSDAVLARARAMGAGYVVLGAFGLPRMVEAVVGGVTEAMLRKSEIPLLLVH